MYFPLVCFLLAVTQQLTVCPSPHSKPSQFCSKDFVPVCGKTADGIGTNYLNDCQACSNSGVVGYDDGLCPFEGPFHPPPLPVLPNYVYCPEPRPLYKCALMKNPVCGIHKTGLPSTYDNGCLACSNRNVVAHLQGGCENIVRRCPAERPECRLDPEPEYPINCVYEKGKQPAHGSGRCCLTSTYIASSTGMCPNFPAATPCPRPRERNCKKILSPVCAATENGKTRTAGNSCLACLDPRVVNYFQGACQ